MTVQLMPDAEVLLISALRTTPVNVLVGGRISDRLHNEFPALRITQIGGTGERVEKSGFPEFQLEAWGNGIDAKAAKEANAIARTVRASIPLLPGRYPAGVIVGAWGIADVLHIPDAETGRERFMVSLGLIIQPTPAVL